jgi:ABC-type ATPase involved in cell division/GNAT superfamily N-acetyltransferase
MFDVPVQTTQRLEWHGQLPLTERPWNVGLIVGPSGCGKSTIGKHLFGNAMHHTFNWTGASVIDDFPAHVPIEHIANICQAVGFNTIPAWLRPFHVLSNGEQFRVTMARLLIEQSQMVVVDEFTSVVDRQVAQITSHAIQKYVRKQQTQFVAMSCHYDIVEWLQPDWILEPATMTFTWRSLQRRPQIAGHISRVPYAFWKLFAPYHYLTADLNKAASCYCLFVDNAPAAFGAMLYRPHPKVSNVYGLSRLVTLPDYQGLGLAFALTDTLASAFYTLGQRFHTYPAHPALIRSFDKSRKWKMEKRPGVWSPKSSANGFSKGGRPCAVFEYVGETMQDKEQAFKLLGIERLRGQLYVKRK